MKNIYKSLLALGLIFSLNSCEDEQDLLFLQPEATFEILSPISGEGAVLNPDTPLNPGVSLTWSEADFGTPTEITYSVEIDKSGDNFDSPTVITSTTNNYVTITSDVLNSASVGVGLTPFSEGGLEIRIKATVGTATSNESFSNVITYLVTTYSTDLPKLAVPGNHQGWNAPTAPLLAASEFGKTDFEGYVWLDGEFKFVAQSPNGEFNFPPNGGPDYGDDGTFSGVLVEENEVNINAASGYYYVKANTGEVTAANPNGLKYSIAIANWAITGAATPNGWPDPALDHDMTYNSSTKKWEIILPLTVNEFKFRANNGWDLNLGGDSNGDEFMDYGGPNLNVATAGTYLIELDLSNPREYTYTLTLQ
ncbi:SusE domain-containing protein [Flavobacterium sp. HNIBRBA15423]|uniref:SusE domain-containing protein n=1 Tax=Flavobacterium sp. HNIBRBA15423 TaxID=3458683 RepID=UPI004044F909